jgi:uncharacterized OB-fold protein
MVVYDKPLPVIDEDTAPYWKYCKSHELRMQKCGSCGHIRFPAGILCPKCHSMEAEWTKLSGKGRIYSFVIFHHAFHPSYKNDIPYAAAIIQLDEGPRLDSNITGCSLEDIRIDMPVEVYFDDVTDDISLPKFRPVTES